MTNEPFVRDKLLFRIIKARQLGLPIHGKHDESFFVANHGVNNFAYFLDEYVSQAEKDYDSGADKNKCWLSRDFEPRDNLGDRLETEFNCREFSANEKFTAVEYFEYDFTQALKFARTYLNLAETSFQNGREFYLRKAFELSQRARKDITRASRIAPELCSSYGVPNMAQELSDFMTGYRDVVEFPCTFQLVRSLREAVAKEKYEEAAVIQKHLDKIQQGID